MRHFNAPQQASEYQRPRVRVCGSRDWSDPAPIAEALRPLRPSLVIHGGCRGADLLADRAAQQLGIPTRVHSADWTRFGRAAGPLRNQRMLDGEQPDLVIAFSTRDPLTPGTADVAARAGPTGIPVEIRHLQSTLSIEPTRQQP